MSRSAKPRRTTSEKWTQVVEVGFGPDGRRRRSRITARTQRELAEKVGAARVATRDGTHVERSADTVEDYLTRWLKTLPVAGRTPATVANYGWVVRTYLVPNIGKVRLQALQPDALDATYARLLDRGLSRRTVRLTHSVIRKALADAIRKGLVARNVADLADPPSAKSARPAHEMRFWTPAQLDRFMDATRDDELGALYRLAAFGGFRRGEVCGLRWGEVDLGAGTVHVRRQLVVVDGRAIAQDFPKSDSGRRTVGLDPTSAAFLREHRHRQLERRMAVGVGWQGDLVFCGPAGEQLHPDGVAKGFVRRSKAVGLPSIRFHDLRHTHASHLIAAGVGIKTISARLGHASTSFTLDVYGHLMPEDDAQAAAAVAALVDGAGR